MQATIADIAFRSIILDFQGSNVAFATLTVSMAKFNTARSRVRSSSRSQVWIDQTASAHKTVSLESGSDLDRF